MSTDFESKNLPLKKTDPNLNFKIEKFDILMKINRYAKFLGYFWLPYLALITATIISFGFIISKGIENNILSNAWIAFFVLLTIILLASIFSVAYEILILLWIIKIKTKKQYLLLGILVLFFPAIISAFLIGKTKKATDILKQEIITTF